MREEKLPMIIVIENRCVGCSLCVPVCPEEAISCFGKAEVIDN
jgi:Fe-S-cluster-containing hydrogenase component 2